LLIFQPPYFYCNLIITHEQIFIYSFLKNFTKLLRKIIQAASIHLIWKLPVKIALIFLKIPASVTANLEGYL